MMLFLALNFVEGLFQCNNLTILSILNEMVYVIKI